MISRVPAAAVGRDYMFGRRRCIYRLGFVYNIRIVHVCYTYISLKLSAHACVYGEVRIGNAKRIDKSVVILVGVITRAQSLRLSYDHAHTLYIHKHDAIHTNVTMCVTLSEISYTHPFLYATLTYLHTYMCVVYVHRSRHYITFNP